MHHLGSDAQPRFALIATALTSTKPPAATGRRDSRNLPARAGSRKPLLSTHVPIVVVPIAWHKPSWAAASRSSLHPRADLSQACGPGKGEADEGRQVSQKEGNRNWAVAPAHWDLLLGKLPSSCRLSRNEKRNYTAVL